jgi:Family of unknown function (DUF5309)
MAKFSGTYNTYTTVGIKEDVSDEIYNISPKTTPFMANAGKGEAAQSLFEWQIDALAAPDGNNAQLEGDDIAAVDTVVPTTRIGNYCQISRKSAATSGTNEAAQKYGRGSELAYDMAKKAAELKRDVETILLQNQAAAAGADNVSPRKTGSILAFIKTNTDKGAGGVDPVWTNIPTSTRTDGTLRSFSEAILKSVMLKCYNSGAEPDTLMLPPAVKQTFSGFTGVATKTIEQTAVKAAAIIGAVDFYVSDFGTLAVVVNRFMRVRDGLFLDFNFCKVSFLRPFFTKPLADTGDAEKRLLLGEYGLEISNEAALGLAADIQP